MYDWNKWKVLEHGSVLIFAAPNLRIAQTRPRNHCDRNGQ